MAKKDAEPEKKPRFAALKQIRDTYVMASKIDKLLGPILAGIFVVIVAVFVVVALLVGPLYVWIPLGVLFGLLAATIVFGRRAERAAYKQVEGRAGAAASALQTLRRGWHVTPAIAVTRSQDTVHRVIGAPGVILVGDGQASRVKHLMTAERKKHQRVAGGAAITEIMAGDDTDAGEIPIRRIARHVMKLPRTLSGPQITDLLNRMKALDAAQPVAPIPKGPVPGNARQAMKGVRQAMKGR